MDNSEGLSNIELKELIIENLKDIGIDPELLDIHIKKNQRVVLRGDIYSEGEGNLIVQTIMDIIGIEHVKNEMRVNEGRSDDFYLDDEEEEYLLDEDNESYGTEDIFRSVEDGLPYVPPMVSSAEKLEKQSRRKKARRQSDIYW